MTKEIMDELKRCPHFKNKAEAVELAIKKNKEGEENHWIGQAPHGEYAVFENFHTHPAIEIGKYKVAYTTMDILDMMNEKSDEVKVDSKKN